MCTEGDKDVHAPISVNAKKAISIIMKDDDVLPPQVLCPEAGPSRFSVGNHECKVSAGTHYNRLLPPPPLLPLSASCHEAGPS